MAIMLIYDIKLYLLMKFIPFNTIKLMLAYLDYSHIRNGHLIYDNKDDYFRLMLIFE